MRASCLNRVEQSFVVQVLLVGKHTAATAPSAGGGCERSEQERRKSRTAEIQQNVRAVLRQRIVLEHDSFIVALGSIQTATLLDVGIERDCPTGFILDVTHRVTGSAATSQDFISQEKGTGHCFIIPLLFLRISQSGVTAGIRCPAFDPHPHRAPFLFRNTDPVMALFQHLQQGTGRAADRAWGRVPETVSTIGDLSMGEQAEEAVRPGGSQISRQQNATVASLIVVTLDAMPIEDRLDVSWKIQHIGQASERFNLIRWTAECQTRRQVTRGRSQGSLLVAAHTTGDLAGHHADETVHPLDGSIVFIERDEKQRPARWKLEIRGTVLLNRHGTQDAFQRKGTQPGHEIGSAGKIHWFRQHFQHEQLANFTPLDTLQIAPFVDIAQ